MYVRLHYVDREMKVLGRRDLGMQMGRDPGLLL